MVKTRKQLRQERGEDSPTKVPPTVMQSQQRVQSAKRPKKTKANTKAKKTVAFNAEAKFFPSTSHDSLPRESRSRSNCRRYSSDSYDTSPRSSSLLFSSRGRDRDRDYHRHRGHRYRDYPRHRSHRSSRYHHRSPTRSHRGHRRDYTPSEYSSFESSSDAEHEYRMRQQRLPISMTSNTPDRGHQSRVLQRRMSMATSNEDPINNSRSSRTPQRRMSMARFNDAPTPNLPTIPAKRRTRAFSGWLQVCLFLIFTFSYIFFIFSVPDNRCCDYHLNSESSPLPWLPKQTTNIGMRAEAPKKKNLPSLMPINVKNNNLAHVENSNVNNPAASGLAEMRARDEGDNLSTISVGQSFGQGVNVATTNEEFYAMQVKLNADIMKEVEVLRSKQSELISSVEKVTKEKEFFKAKLEKTAEQLDFLKKKLNRKEGKDSKENFDPNQQ